jgi:hypothetical protein
MDQFQKTKGFTTKKYKLSTRIATYLKSELLAYAKKYKGINIEKYGNFIRSIN